MNPRITEWLKQSRVETPILVIDLEVVRQKYQDFRNAFFDADIHYAVKANTHFDILRRLAKEGAGFYVSSPTELDNVMQTGVNPLKIAYSHTVKKATDIAYAWRHGVRNFTFDSIEELKKIAQNAPYSHVFCRLDVSQNPYKDLALYNKGCSPDNAEALMVKAARLELNPIGLSFHLGSMQTDIDAYLKSLDFVSSIYSRLKAKGIHLQKINIGGGFPVAYGQNDVDISLYGQRITQKVHDLFGKNKLIVEPGRALVAEAGIMAAEIVLIKKQTHQLYLDVGYYNGLKEIKKPHILYPIQTDYNLNETLKSCSLWGISGDDNDRLYKNISLPRCLKEGDKIYITFAGAYTNTTANHISQSYIFPRSVCLPVAEDMPLFAQKVINLSDARTGRKKSLWG